MQRTIPYKFIIAFLLCCWLPFVAITDFFPFMRMGMFAEPIKEEFQTERFEIIVYRNDTPTIYQPSLDGTDASVLHYLIRNYYYRNQTDLFLNRLNPEKHYLNADSVKLFRYTKALDSNANQEDTSCIGKRTLQP